MLTLYYAQGACSTASHIALEESGAQYASTPIDFGKEEQYGERYLKINPRGKVPALKLDDGFVVTENLAILLLIARLFPQAELLPDDPIALAQCHSLMSWFSNTVHPAFRQIRRPGRFADAEFARAAIVEYGRKAFWTYLEEIDRMLAGRKWIGGDVYSLCDSYALVFYGWGLYAQLPVTELENYTGWKGRMLARPAVRTVLEREGNIMLKTSAS